MHKVSKAADKGAQVEQQLACLMFLSLTFSLLSESIMQCLVAEIHLFECVIACTKIAACMQAVLPATCLQLLGLPQHVRHKLDMQLLQSHLLQIAARPPLSHPSSTLFAPHDSFAKCNTGTSIHLRPVAGCFSLFSGQTGPEGRPLLNPNQFPLDGPTPPPIPAAERPPNQTLPAQRCSIPPSRTPHQKGALDLCVGDAVSLAIEVHSAMPDAVQLEDVTLTLALLQEVTIAYSPKSATSSRTDFSQTASSAKQRTTDSPLATGSARSRSGDLAAAAAEDADVITQWQETEELACLLCAAHPSGSLAGSDPKAGPHRGVSSDTAMLQPGINTLSFRVVPLKPGLYTLKHMQASLGSLSLHIPVILKEPNALSQQSQAAAQQPPMAASDAASTRAAALGTVLSTGEIQQESVILNVHSCRQRLAVCAAALRGTLVAGHPQWLAIAVVPMHDALSEASIHLGLGHRALSGTDQTAAASSSVAALGGSGSSTSMGYTPQEDGPHPPHGPGLHILHPDRAVIAPLLMPGHPSETGATSAPLPTQPSGGPASLAPQRLASLQRQPTWTPLPQDTPAAGVSGEEALGEATLRYDAGTEASVSGSSWVSMEASQGPNLPAWAATRPSLLWLWVQPGMLPCSESQHSLPSIPRQ